jgi:hypothetical protein
MRRDEEPATRRLLDALTWIAVDDMITERAGLAGERLPALASWRRPGRLHHRCHCAGTRRNPVDTQRETHPDVRRTRAAVLTCDGVPLCAAHRPRWVVKSHQGASRLRRLHHPMPDRKADHMTTRTNTCLAAALATSLLAITACGGSTDSAPEDTAPPLTSARATTVDSTDSTITSTSTTTSTTSTSTSTTTTLAVAAPETIAGNGDGFLSADLGPRLVSVPGVNSPGELIEIFDNVVMFIPSEPDPNDNNVYPPLPEDKEILIAYAKAEAAVYEQTVQNPVPIEPSQRMQSAYLDGGEQYRPVFEQLNRDGQHLDFQFGIDLSRPVVIADPRSDTQAFVFSCGLVASVLVNADGSIVEGEVPNDRQPIVTEVVKQDDGTWIANRVQEDERACI